MPFFVRGQFFFFALSILLPTVCYGLVILGAGDPHVMSHVAASAMVVCWLAIVTAPVLLSGGATRAERLTAVIFFWSLITVWAPVMWDFTWFLVHRVVDGATAEDRWLWYWWMYGAADTRFLRSDPLMVVLEAWSGILGFVHAYALVQFSRGRVPAAFFVATVANAVQFYGTSVFFGHEALLGFRNIDPSFFSFYVTWWGMNGFWLIMPWVTTYAYAQLLKDQAYDARAAVRRVIFGRPEGVAAS